MKLKNPFPLEVRKLYLDCWACWICGTNGQHNGGLEIHHIMGRISDSAFNSSCLCHGCHEHMNHNQEEEQMLFLKTLEFLYNSEYNPTDNDLRFLGENYQRLNNPKLQLWLKQKQ